MSHGLEIVADHRRFYACKSLRLQWWRDLSDRDALEIQYASVLIINWLLSYLDILPQKTCPLTLFLRA